MKTVLIAALMLAGNISFAAIQVKCLIQTETKYASNLDESGYSSSSVEKSLPDGHVTGSFDFDEPVQGRKIQVEVSSLGISGPYISSICAQDKEGSVCSQPTSGLVIVSYEGKSNIDCQLK